MQINFKLQEGARLPTRGKTGDAGLDLYVSNEVAIMPYAKVIVRTGVSCEIPPGYYGKVTPRSSTMRDRELLVIDGTVDSGYRGEIGISVKSLNSEPVRLIPGDRIAQLIVLPYLECDPVEVDELSETDRGEDGFGSTGR